MERKCFECGQRAETDHHVVPQSRGGTKTVPLCGKCHAKAHHKDGNMAHGRLIKEGLAKAKARGVLLGFANPKRQKDANRVRGPASLKGAKVRKSTADEWHQVIYPVIREQRDAGNTLRAIARHMNAEGYLSRDGKPFSESAIHYVLRRARIYSEGRHGNSNI